MKEPLQLPVVAATLTEDRANVRRSARLTLSQGAHRFIVEDVSPIIVDKTLHGFLDSSAGAVLDLRVVRRPRFSEARSSPEAEELHQRLEAQRREVEKCRRDCEGAELAVESHLTLIEQWAAETGCDVAVGTGDSKRWTKDWTALEKRLWEIQKEQVLCRRREEQAQEELQRLKNSYQKFQDDNQEWRAVLELTLVMDRPAEVELSVQYCVPNACWRPYHVAEWNGDRLLFRAEACLWQNTGESWNDVRLDFSTERISLGTEAPRLESELLYTQGKQKRTVVETRQETVHSLEEKVSAVPGIQTGGETLRFQATHSSTVPSDGRPHRVALFEFHAAAEEERVVMAELSPTVFVRTRQVNTTSGPLLAGPIDLVKSCGIVGRGQIEMVASGETFTISWGPHPELRCHRREKAGPEDSPWVGGWRSREHEVEVQLSNLGPTPQKLQVLERLPVSEISSVKVEQDVARTTGHVQQDSNGFLTFALELPAYGHKTVSLVYLVSRKKDVEGL